MQNETRNVTVLLVSRHFSVLSSLNRVFDRGHLSVAFGQGTLAHILLCCADS